MFIGALTKCGTVESAIAAEKLLDIMVDLHKKGSINNDGGPCTITFNSILTGWEKTKSSIGGQRATSVLHKMIGLYRLGNHAVKPDSLSFNMTISAIINGHPQNYKYQESHTIGRDAQKIYDEMIYFHKHEDRYIKPDVSTLNNVLNAYAKSNSHESAQMALDLLRNTQRMYNNKELDILPNTTSYNIIIGALSSRSDNESRSDDSKIAIIEKLMDEMESSYTSGSNIDAKVDTVTYNSLIRTYCSLKDKTKAALRADSVLTKMIDLYNKGNNVQPDNVSFNSVISAYAKMPGKDAAQKASDVLHRMQSFHDAGHPGVKPDTVSISLIITAILQSAKYGGDKVMMANQALAILKRMEDLYKFSSTEHYDKKTKPDAITYTSAIECLVMSGGKGCGEKAEQILKSMEQMYFHDNMESDDLKPDTTSYNAVLRAYASSGEKDAAEKTETFLKRMMNNNVEEKVLAGRRRNVLYVQPNVLSFGIVIDAWAKSGERNAPQRAERLLEFMIDQSKNDSNHVFKPNAVVFSSCITAWSRSKHPKAAERASMLLEKMENLSTSSSEIDDDLLPNAYVYSSVLEAWSNCPNKQQIGPKVDEILNGLKCKANVVILNTAIKAIGRSNYTNKAEKATQILDKLMTEHGVLPNIRTYNALLTCFAATQRSPQSPNDDIRIRTWNAAFKLFDNIRSDKNMDGSIGNRRSVKPDAYTYPAMLKVCQNLLPSLEKNKEESDTFECIKKVVERCCQDGMVDALFLNNLKSYVNNDNQLRALFGKGLQENNSHLQLRTLPNEWKKNAPNQRKSSPKKDRNRKR